MCPMMIRSQLSDPNLCEDTGSPGAEDRHYGSESGVTLGTVIELRHILVPKH